MQMDTDKVSKKLAIPHLAQRGMGADASRNDCGPAVVAMAVAGLTDQDVDVDAAGRACGQKKDQTTQFYQLENGLRHYGLEAVLRNELQADGRIYPEEIRAEIGKGNPVILVVWYPFLSYRKQIDYKGWHFVLAVGYDETGIFIHDPLFGETWRQRGAFVHVPDAELKQAQVGNGKNLPYQGMIVVSPAPLVTEADEVPLDLKTGEAMAAELVRLHDEVAKWETLYNREHSLRMRLETAVQNALGALQVVGRGK